MEPTTSDRKLTYLDARGVRAASAEGVMASYAEELANALTHGFGLLLSLAGLFLLIAAALVRGEAGYLVSGAVFGGTLVFMYAASTLYHLARDPALRHILRVVDHISIYLVIAGSYTPFLLVYFTGGWRLGLMVTIWTLALAGTVFKLFYTGRYPALSTGFYLAMGWMAVIVAKPFLALMPPGALPWLVAGGLLYTGGVVFFVWERLPYHHAIWHLFVLGGSGCHFIAVAEYVLR